jgi:hypothetical protein
MMDDFAWVTDGLHVTFKSRASGIWVESSGGFWWIGLAFINGVQEAGTQFGDTVLYVNKLFLLNYERSHGISP